MRISVLGLTAIGFVLCGPARAQEPLHLLAAGSLSGAMTEELARSGIPANAIASPVFGPSGVLRGRIEAGERADILASADMQQPEKLSAERGGRPVVMFTRNRMCALAPARLGITSANLLDRMLDPHMRLATSTPGADPGGDYAWAVFARAEALHPGAKEALEAKSMQLVGGPDSRPFIPGKGQVQGVFLADRADIMLGYCSGSAEVMRDVPGLASIPLPPDLTVGPVYGMVVLTDSPLAARFATFVMSERGQTILTQHGFLPVAAEPTANAPTPIALTEDTIAHMPTVTLPIAFDTEHGRQSAEFEGPLLWTVLVQGKAIDPADARRQVRRSVLVTGSDGYTAVLALGEISPDFEGKQVILAERMNGVPLGAGHLRIVVPGDRFGGRSVRDVVSIRLLHPAN